MLLFMFYRRYKKARYYAKSAKVVTRVKWLVRKIKQMSPLLSKFQNMPQILQRMETFNKNCPPLNNNLLLYHTG